MCYIPLDSLNPIATLSHLIEAVLHMFMLIEIKQSLIDLFNTLWRSFTSTFYEDGIDRPPVGYISGCGSAIAA